jgi:hypothetical protein
MSGLSRTWARFEANLQECRVEDVIAHAIIGGNERGFIRERHLNTLNAWDTLQCFGRSMNATAAGHAADGEREGAHGYALWW